MNGGGKIRWGALWLAPVGGEREGGGFFPGQIPYSWPLFLVVLKRCCSSVQQGTLQYFLLFKTSYGISDSDKRYTLNYTCTLTVHTYAVLSYTVQSGLLTNTPLRSLLTDVLFKIPCTVKASDLVLASLTSLRFFFLPSTCELCSAEGENKQRQWCSAGEMCCGCCFVQVLELLSPGFRFFSSWHCSCGCMCT